MILQLIKVTFGLFVVATWPLWKSWVRRKWYERKAIEEYKARRNPYRLAGTVSTTEAVENLNQALRAQKLIQRNWVCALVTVRCPECSKAHTVTEERYETRQHVCPKCTNTYRITLGP